MKIVEVHCVQANLRRGVDWTQRSPDSLLGLFEEHSMLCEGQNDSCHTCYMVCNDWYQLMHIVSCQMSDCDWTRDIEWGHKPFKRHSLFDTWYYHALMRLYQAFMRDLTVQDLSAAFPTKITPQKFGKRSRLRQIDWSDWASLVLNRGPVCFSSLLRPPHSCVSQAHFSPRSVAQHVPSSFAYTNRTIWHL